MLQITAKTWLQALLYLRRPDTFQHSLDVPGTYLPDWTQSYALLLQCSVQFLVGALFIVSSLLKKLLPETRLLVHTEAMRLGQTCLPHTTEVSI